MSGKAVIFTEGGILCGYGHITRCTALYDEMIRRGISVEFIIHGEESETLKNTLQGRAYQLKNWCNGTMNENGSEPQKDYAVVDSYLATKETYEQIASGFRKVLYIDDTNRLEYPKGIVVNPSIFGEGIPYVRKTEQRYLLGSRYVILRNEFREWNRLQLPSEKEAGTMETEMETSIHRILIIMGGSDIKNLMGVLEETIKHSKYKNAGRIIAKNMSALQIRDCMLRCDIAITAAGQTVHELIACKLPFVCIQVIDNQEYNVQGLLDRGIIQDYIDCEGMPEEANRNVQEKLIKLMEELEDSGTREAVIRRMDDLDLGQGARNIVDVVVNWREADADKA